MTFSHHVPMLLLLIGRRKERREAWMKREVQKVIEEGWNEKGEDVGILEGGLKG